MTVVAAVTEDAFERVRELAPSRVDVVPLDGASVARAAFVVPSSADREVLDALADAAAVEVVQVLSAGTDWIEHRLPPRATLCNARGARDVPVAEWVVGALLGAYSGLLHAARARRWDYRPGRELAGTTVVVLGSGSIGEAVRARLAPFGVTVEGVARRAREGVHGADALPGLLPRADVLVVLLPLADATRGMVDAAMLSALPDGALVVNAGRGAVLDTSALQREVESGRLRAVLDVTDPEPLPDDHPLWRLDGVLAITAHFAGDTREADSRAVDLAAEQLARFVSGEPLLHVVRAPG